MQEKKEEAEVAALYRGPLEEFTAKRNELAKELNDPGIAKLKKPTAAAWLVNQLAERKPAQVERLLEAAEDLRARQEELLAGDADAEALRSAAREEQRAVEDLLKTATALAHEHGSSGQVIDRVAETLQAASGDADLADAIRQGTVVREQRASSVGFAAGMAPPAGKKAKKPAQPTANVRRAREAAERRRKDAEREVSLAQKQVKAAAHRLGKAREEAAQREIELKTAEKLLDAARKELKKQTG